MWIEILGLVASAITLMSFVVQGERRIRSINAAGAALLTVYGILISSASVILLNFILCAVHFYHLRRIGRGG